MRLHRLEVTAFLAFAGRESVDFDALEEAGLFLLHGETGAGKTSLLDAVCFALYGRVPGERHHHGSLRSDHADPQQPTEVSLDVTLRGTRLRITRRPKQERPKQRGEGTTESAAQVTVERHDDCDGTWTVIATRADEAGLEIGALLGMSCEQFCQVVLLPQGAFASFLRAKSDDRYEILEELFATERFSAIEGDLVARRKAADLDVRAAEAEIGQVLARVSQVADVAVPEDWSSDHGETLAWAQGRAVLAEAQAASAGDAAAQAGAACDAARAALAEAKGLADLQRRHREAVDALATHRAARPRRDAADRELAAARTAAPVAERLAAAGEAHAAWQEAAQDARAATAALDADGRDAAARGAEALRALAGSLREQSGRVRAFEPAELAMRRRAEDLADLAARIAAEVACAQRAEAWLAEAGPRRDRLAADVQEAGDAAAGLGALEAVGAAAGERAQAGRRRDEIAADLNDAEAELARRAAAAQDAREAWLDIRQRRLDGMAGELAAGLRDGEACAVCGSLEHPAPAVATADAATAEAEREAQAAADAAAAQRADAEACRAALAEQLAAAQAQAGDAAAEELAAVAEEFSERLAGARALAARHPAATAALEAHDAEVAARQAECARARELAAALTGERDALAAEAQADVDEVELLRAGASTLGDRAAALDAAADRTDAAAAALDAEAAAAVRREQAHAAAALAAQRAGFPDLDAARAAGRDPAELAALDAEVRTFDERLARLQAACEEEAVVAAAGLPAPDLAALSAGAADAERAAADAERVHGLAQHRVQELAGLVETLSDRLDDLRPRLEHAALVRELAGLADGSSTRNRKRMRLSAYVLAARLEQIAEAASVRLDRMTNGRYTLVHDDSGAKGNKRGGLDLLVVDGWTGRDRHPSTLSGGETFLASLALALGLADVVTAEAGGARLDTLFVDEGFGSLDEDALDEVLDVLDGLRDGGRTVGVVSHVPELKQRIQAQVQVRKGRHGSRVEQRTAAAA